MSWLGRRREPLRRKGDVALLYGLRAEAALAAQTDAISLARDVTPIRG